MNDEQHRVVFFQAQPEGLGRFFRPTALSGAYVNDYTALLSPCRTKKATPAVMKMKRQQTLVLRQDYLDGNHDLEHLNFL